MIKNILAGVLLSIVSITSTSAMTTSSSGDQMMKKEMSATMIKDDGMMKDKSMADTMKKEMMERDTMMKTSAPLTDVYMGQRGDSVMMLQKYLVEKGFLSLPAGVTYGFFGSLTKKAVMMYQESIGVTPTGFFGPLTRGKMSEKMKMMDGDTMMKKEGETMKGETMKKGDAMAQ